MFRYKDFIQSDSYFPELVRFEEKTQKVKNFRKK